MFKLILIVTLVAYCLSSPAEDNGGNIQHLAMPDLKTQPVDRASAEDSSESDESWRVDKREASQTEPTEPTEPTEEEDITTTEDYDLIRIREVNALAEPPAFSIVE